MKDILRRWKEYGERLFQDVDDSNSDSNDDSNMLHHMPEILEAEVKEAIRRLPNNKAVGVDDLPVELLKTNNDMMTKVLTKLCNKICETGEWPADWMRAVFVALPKVAGIADCSEHRTIALINHTSKILLRILLNRMEQTAE